MKTATEEDGLEQVRVQTDQTGTPLTVLRDGRLWVVDPEPLRWYERTSWWKEVRRMPKGQGRMDIQVWRIQARFDLRHQTDVLAMDLEHDSGAWRIREAVPV